MYLINIPSAYRLKKAAKIYITKKLSWGGCYVYPLFPISASLPQPQVPAPCLKLLMSLDLLDCLHH